MNDLELMDELAPAWQAETKDSGKWAKARSNHKGDKYNLVVGSTPNTLDFAIRDLPSPKLGRPQHVTYQALAMYTSGLPAEEIESELCRWARMR